MGLILPALFSELEGKALPLIINELKVAISESDCYGLDKANEDQYVHALQFFSELPQHSEYCGMMDPV